MADSTAKTNLDSIREWIVENKLRSVGNFPHFLLLPFCVPVCLCTQLIMHLVIWFGGWIESDFGFVWLCEKGCLWLSGIAGSIAYNWSQPAMKTSVKLIHARYPSQFYCLLYKIIDFPVFPFGIKLLFFINVLVSNSFSNWMGISIKSVELGISNEATFRPLDFFFFRLHAQALTLAA